MIRNKHPASRFRLLDQGVLELPPDSNGEADGEEYSPFLTINDIRAVFGNVRQGVPGVWSGRYHELGSAEEEAGFFALEGMWSVLSIREQYWFYRDVVNEEAPQEERPNRVNVVTLDAVLTRPPLSLGGPLRYDAVSFKPANLMHTARATRRHYREMSYCEGKGWRWFPLKKPTKLNYENHKRLRSWAIQAPSPIDDAADDARALSELLYRTTSEKELEDLLRMVGKRLGIPPSDQAFVLSAAYYLGYIAVDHQHELMMNRPLALERSPRWASVG